MNTNGVRGDIRPATKHGVLKAHADVRLEILGGELIIHGFSVVQQDGKPPWIGFPSRPGSSEGKFFPVVGAVGQIRELLVKAILDAYDGQKSRS